MRPIHYSFGPLAAADADGIAQAQTPAGAGALTLNGALVSGGVATMDVARRVLVTAAANESARTLTITGTNWNGDTISETMTGPNATTDYTDADFKTVTSVTIDGAATGNISVGTNGVASSPPIPVDVYSRSTIGLQVKVSGTINWTIQQTVSDVFVEDTTSILWMDHEDTDLVAETVNRQGNYAYAFTATRIVINSGTGSLIYSIAQPLGSY